VDRGLAIPARAARGEPTGRRADVRDRAAAAAVLLALYLIGRAAAFASRVDGTLRHASATAAYIAARWVRPARRVLVFAALRLRAGKASAPARSLLAWAGTFVVAAVVLRLEYR